MIFLFVLQEVLQFGVGLYALQLVSDNLPDLGTDTVVVILDHLLHAVVAAETKPKNADPTRTHLNRELVEFPDGVSDRTEAISHRIRTAGIKRKIPPIKCGQLESCFRVRTRI